MELERAIQIALDGDAIMLTGAGFSYGAKNVKRGLKGKNNNIPLGNELKKILLDDLGIKDADAKLEDVSEYYIKIKGKSELIRILTECFTVSIVAEYHKKVMEINWRRLYTTNYDKVAEISALSSGNVYKTISLDDSFDESKRRICLHINGVVDKLNEKTLNSGFKLTNRSYNSENLVDNPWFDYMARNFQSAKVIFIVGFSMSYDLDIKRIISSITGKDNVIFITGSTVDVFEMSRLESYGTIYPIGMDGFANKIEEISKHYSKKVSMEYEYGSFLYNGKNDILPKDDTNLADIIKFYSQGLLKDSLLTKNSLGYGKYVVFRKQLRIIIDKWKSMRAFVVSSYLGNGKTVFCYELVKELREREIDAFFLINETIDVNDDVEMICDSNKKCIVIIDDFYKHYEVLRSFNDYNCKNITFVLTGRITKEESNIQKIRKQLKLGVDEIYPISLNKISEDECDSLAAAMHNEHFVPRTLEGKNIEATALYLQNECRGRIADIVLYLYESSPVREKLNVLYRSAVEQDKELKHLTISSVCNTVMSLGLSRYDIGSIYGIDFVVAKSSATEIFDELFESGDYNSELKSSIVAREILYNVIDHNDTMSALIKMAEYANAQRIKQKRFNEVLKALVSHYNFSTDKYSFPKSYVKKFYEEVRNLEFYRENPFFWEQFALACMDIYDFRTARQCITNAYAEGEKRCWFVPFQICTIEADLIITELTYRVSSLETIGLDTVYEVSNSITQAKEKLLKYYNHEENNKGYVFSITGQIPRLYDLVKEIYTNKEHSTYIEDMSELRQMLEIYAVSEEGKRNYSITKIKQDVDNSILNAKTYLRNN